MKKVIIYTDGSCLGNPGRGGWAAILYLVGSTARRELVGGARLTTNNRMELGGVIAALSALREACEVDLYTDSKYVCDAVEKGWLAGWQKRNWIKSDKKPVLNVDSGSSSCPCCAPTRSPSTGCAAMPGTARTNAATNWPAPSPPVPTCPRTRASRPPRPDPAPCP